MKSFYQLCCFLFGFSVLSSITFVFWSQPSPPCNTEAAINLAKQNKSIDILAFPSSLNQLSFSAKPPPRLLKVALFVKRWPQRNLAGGLERHALTLHLALARRGHDIHVFTTELPSNATFPRYDGAVLSFHPTQPSPAGYLNQALAWEQFRIQNATGRPFDVIHTESVGLLHGRARNITNLAASWHGIAYETIHSDVVQDLLRGPDEPRRSIIAERLAKVIEEVKFFPHYAHHVATSDHVGDVLKRVYMIPEERVHIIVNGVDESVYRPDPKVGEEFRRKVGVPKSASLVIGLAGRLVKDKGHPLMFEALKQAFMEEEGFQREVFVLVAGDGPWGSRYKELGENVIVLGPLEQTELAKFYKSIDVYLNPTLRAQGLDHTFIEAMLSGVPIAGTRFASITGSLIVGSDIGYTFLPKVESIKESLYKIMGDGKRVLSRKGEVARNRALHLFTATQMAAAYERLFLCISKSPAVKDYVDYCKYPLPWVSGGQRTY
ncbi:hypothetical protein Cni_G10756 [Canna indica]|uniref:Glycosyltransferase subfamily 4-like N-terminal domain-containing protein n=1 Tax=Canna indica TaxID=4628 RepID=A0AAQ3K552_9LILI|nr:hypothetical protein Cni_G10756 [Canna indica]